MQLSVKSKINGSFSVLVILFVVNGLIAIITLNSMRDLSAHVSQVVNPSLHALVDFRKMILESRSYATNWVFLRFREEDKKLLKELHEKEYPKLKKEISGYAVKWKNRPGADSLKRLFAGFEELIRIEKSIMVDLKGFKDYDDPVVKLEAERKIEEDILPRTTQLMRTLHTIYSDELKLGADENSKVERSSMRLRYGIIILAITITCAGFFLSLYMVRLILRPVNKIRRIINTLGKGIVSKKKYSAGNDEIGEMIRSLNDLSEKLHATASFATDVGNRNFDTYFEPPGPDDVLGKALLVMRENIKASDEKFNQAQHLAHLGSLERDMVTGKLYLSDEMFNILDLDATTFDGKFENIIKMIHPQDQADFMKYREKYLRNQRPEDHECRIITAKGVSKHVSLQSKVVVGANGKISGVMGIVQDITERKRAQSNLAGVNRELNILFNSIDEIFFSVNMEELKVIQVSATCEKVYGYKQAEFLADYRLWFDIIHPDDKHIIEYENDILQRGEQVNNQYRIIRRDGTLRWVETKITPTLDEAGNLIRVDGVTRDITDRKKVDEALKTSEAFNKGVLASLSAHIAVIDNTGSVIAVNKAWQEFSISSAESDLNHTSIGSNYFDVCKRAINEGDQIARQTFDGIVSVLEKKLTIFELEYPCDFPGKIRWILLHVMNFESDTPKVVISHQDITQRKLGEEKLLQSEQYNRNLFNQSTLGLALTRMDGTLEDINEAYAKITGYSIEECKAMKHYDITPEKYFLQEAEILFIVKSTGRYGPYEKEYIHKNGHLVPVILSGTILEKDGIPYIWSSVEDITGRKKSEAALYKSEERYRQIVETAQEGIWMIDENDDTNFVNKKMCEIIEYSMEELMGEKISYFMDVESREASAPQIERRKQGISEIHDAVFVTKSGKNVCVNLSTNPVFDDDGNYKGALAMITDITKRKHNEELLQRSQANLAVNVGQLEQKNKELEQFAYVASHDLQEPLRTTTSFVEIFKQQYFGQLDSRADTYLNYITQASDRMGVLIKDLLDFSRIGHNKDPEEVNCNLILQDVIADINTAIESSGATIRAGDLPLLLGFATELKQLFQNLIMNSIKFSKKDITPEITIAALKKNNYWQFEFKDNGIGIERQYNERIFIIFQRLHTRTEYQGSGIGLSHCKKIVELHDGKIWVESEPNKGSTFYFTIHSPKQKLNERKTTLLNAN